MNLRHLSGLLCAFAVLTAWPAGAQPPANDACGANRAAFTLPGLGGQVTGTFWNATRDGSACAGIFGVDVYYYFTPPVAGPWRLSLCASNSATAVDTVLSIHTDSCPVSDQNYATPGNALTSCNDDSPGCISRLSQIDSVPLGAGVSYIIRVARFSSQGFGEFTLQVINLASAGACCAPTGACQIRSVSLCSSASFLGEGTVCSPNPCPQPPANDACAAAAVLQGESADVLGTTVRATSDGSSSCGATGSRDVWYSFVPSVTGGYTLSLCQSAASWDSVLSVHAGCPGAFDNQVPGGCNDDGCLPAGQVGGHAVIPQVNLLAGTGYLVRVAGRGSGGANSGDFRLTIAPAAGACCASDGACSSVSAANCPAGGLFILGAPCTPSPCPLSTGACCRGATCLVASSASCSGPNTAFAGVGTVCNNYPSTTGACCLSDYNHAGGVSVQDLFDFLANYFGGDPGADINRSGAISVEDIFNFLEAYFRGGC